MLCPSCKEEIVDGAIKCKHCQSMLNEAEQPIVAPKEVAGTESQPTEAAPEENANSNGENRYSKSFKLFEEKKYRVILGIPIFANFRDQLSVFWWWALPASPLNPIMYILCGMWKKGLVMAGIYGSILGIIKFIETSLLQGRILLLLLFILMFYVGATIDYDIYRKKIRQEDFWW